MESDPKSPSDDNVPSFFSSNDKNTEELSHVKNDKTYSFEQPLKKSQRTSNRILHWPSLGIGAGVAIACIFSVFLILPSPSWESVNIINNMLYFFIC